MARRLQKADSDAGFSHLDDWQVAALQEVEGIFQESYSAHRALAPIIMEIPTPAELKEAEESLASTAMHAWVPSQGEMTEEGKKDHCIQMSKKRLGVDTTPGTLGMTTIYHWHYNYQSFWRGISDNSKIVKITKSILATGFHINESIVSRGQVQNGHECQKLLFGDGQARGLAAKLAWTVFSKVVRVKAWQPSMTHIFDSLTQLPTMFEEHQDATDALVSQVVRQNVKAHMTKPVSSFEWARIVLTSTYPGQLPADILDCSSFEAREIVGKKLLDTLDRMINRYHSHQDVQTFDVQPQAKRPKKGRMAKKSLEAEPQVEDVEGVQMGKKKEQAVRNILQGCTKDSFSTMENHMVWAADFSLSCWTDLTLGIKWLWPGSPPPLELLPDESARIARDAGLRFKCCFSAPSSP